MSGGSLRVFKYDVSSSPISVHLPVSRFLAGKYSVMGQGLKELRHGNIVHLPF